MAKGNFANCDACNKQKTRKTSSRRFMQLPRVLSLVLNRFERRDDGSAAGKRTTAVSYPATLDLTEESTLGFTHTRKYELVAVSHHVSDTDESGHYEATCRIHTSSSTTTTV
jgi:hypothetical protein